MWNYRIVRKRYVYTDPESNKERVDYTYAIHEAFCDNNGKVGAITQDHVAPLGDNIEDLRHSWVMMAEAFGQPVLDYDNIPEPGYERENDPIGSVLDERGMALEDGTAKTISWQEMKKDLEERFGPLDVAAHRKQIEEDRIEKERVHNEGFIGNQTLEELIKKLYSDYRAHHPREKTESETCC
ncbi:hypothetical protein [Desulforegula conservatrix]|uniref:hypothetical protein n=1 Tax=Desulforegula conservatrix TaxID=153026 RepID=UPI0004168E70|nr:hypothetical protein [Desulforegula conservatrix]